MCDVIYGRPFREEMHHVQPAAVQIRPAEAFNLTRKAQIFCIQLVCLIKALFEWVKTSDIS